MAKSTTLTMAGLGAMAIGAILLIVIFAIIPLIGEEVDGAVTLGPASEWNHSVNADIPTAVDFWESVSPFITLAAIMLFIGGFISTLKGLRG